MLPLQILLSLYVITNRHWWCGHHGQTMSSTTSLFKRVPNDTGSMFVVAYFGCKLKTYPYRHIKSKWTYRRATKFWMDEYDYPAWWRVCVQFLLFALDTEIEVVLRVAVCIHKNTSVPVCTSVVCWPLSSAMPPLWHVYWEGRALAAGGQQGAAWPDWSVGLGLGVGLVQSKKGNGQESVKVKKKKPHTHTLETMLISYVHYLTY